jgi:hypothetical protein
MIDELLAMYRDGAITGYQVMIDCLKQIDPKHPEAILSRLPDEILDEISEYVRRYNPSCMRSLAGPPPAEAQVKATQQWIEEGARRQRDERKVAS